VRINKRNSQVGADLDETPASTQTRGGALVNQQARKLHQRRPDSGVHSLWHHAEDTRRRTAAVALDCVGWRRGGEVGLMQMCLPDVSHLQTFW